MSFWDAMDDSDGMLPLFGIGGVIVFVICMAFAFCNWNTTMKSGDWSTIEKIGTCHDGQCLVRVKTDDGRILDRETGSRVFEGDRVKCGFSSCFKD